jgi:hypothetical protein
MRRATGMVGVSLNYIIRRAHLFVRSVLFRAPIRPSCSREQRPQRMEANSGRGTNKTAIVVCTAEERIRKFPQ